MVSGVGHGHRAHEQVESIYEALVEDEGLLDEVWLVFEHEVGGNLANTDAWISRRPGEYARGENRWTYALVRLAAEGRLDRQRLLDASLDALMRDFRPSGLGWYAQLHETLEPTLEERQARLDRYLALVTSPAPPALKEGLAGIKELGDAVPPEDLARSASAALLQPQKTHAVAMLRQLEAAAKRDEQARPVLLGAAAQALSHEKQDVQERALRLLDRYPDDVPRAELLAQLDAVAPTLRSRVEALTGLETTREIAAPPIEELTGPAAVAIQNGRWPDPRLPELVPSVDPLEPVESVDELIELAAALLEGQGSGDDAERFVDGVSRLCEERPRGFESRTAGLVERAGTKWFFGPQPIVSGQDAIAILVRAWARGRKPTPRVAPGRTFGTLFARRIQEVASRVAKSRAHTLRSFPSHAGGWLDGETLAGRPQPKGLLRRDSEPSDALVAKLRSLSATSIGLMPEQTLGRNPWGGRAAASSRRADHVVPFRARRCARDQELPRPARSERG